VPLTAKAETLVFGGNPVLSTVQLVPLLVERKTPPSVPAKRFCPLNARHSIPVYRVVSYTDFCIPSLTPVQLVPVLVERKTPLPVPANRFEPETAIQPMVPP
jgi:hypothetical protein